MQSDICDQILLNDSFIWDVVPYETINFDALTYRIHDLMYRDFTIPFTIRSLIDEQGMVVTEWKRVNSVKDMEFLIFWMLKFKSRFYYEDIGSEIPMHEYMRKLGEFVARIVYLKGEPGLYFTRGFKEIFEQPFFPVMTQYFPLRFLAIDSCRVFYNHWVPYDERTRRAHFLNLSSPYINHYNFTKLMIGRVKYHSKHQNKHDEMCSCYRHYTDCRPYLRRVGVRGDRRVTY